MTEPRRPRFYLAEWIKSSGLTLEEVADRAGLSKTHVAQLRQGKRRWNEGVVIALASALGLKNALDLFRDPSNFDDVEALFDRIPPGMRPTARQILRGLAEPERPEFSTDVDPASVPGRKRKRP